LWNSPLEELVRLRNTVKGKEKHLSPVVTDFDYETVEHIASSLSYEPRPYLPCGTRSIQILTKLCMACDEVDDYIHWMMEEEPLENNKNLRSVSLFRSCLVVITYGSLLGTLTRKPEGSETCFSLSRALPPFEAQLN
jgi:hypothetical protein